MMATLHNSPAGDIAKVEQLLLYIFQKVADKPNVGETVLHKLLYFIDFDHYEIHEEPLMGCRYVRNHYGPTVVGLDQWLADMVIRGDIEPVDRIVYEYRQRGYKSLRDPDMSGFSEEQISHVDSVLERLSDMTAKAISDFSHGDYPWMAASDGEILDYEAVFYRDERHSVRDYDEI